MSDRPLPTDELIQILEDLSVGYIDETEAARRAHLWETEPGRYNCGTCRFFRNGIGQIPGRPPCSANAYTVRCGWYEPRDRRDETLPIEAVKKTNSSKMFK